ncbi:MAG: type 2 lantipeptide synthetase LanM family protein [Gemmatimonadaceae bacterium]|nr:type 2 lantipeptide synthetase LanM family protein [Gemmatimonadaceae bacterium]
MPTALHLESLVARAVPLRERARQHQSSAIDRDGSPNAVPSTLLTTWCELAASGSWATFEKRLTWDGFTAAAMADLVQRSGAEQVSDLPAWACHVRDAWLLTPEFSDDGFPALEESHPFGELLLPLARLGRHRVVECHPDWQAVVSAAALAQLEGALLSRLCRVAMRVLYAEFSVYRSLRSSQGLGAMLASSVSGGPPRTLYDAFLRDMRTGGLARICSTYPVLARLLGTATDLWVTVTGELLERLRADLPALEATFGEGQPLGLVTDIRADLSDPHDGGRSVYIVTWASGLRLVYKPRPLGLEQRMGELVAWLDGIPGVPSLRALRVLDRGHHGWLEFAAHTPCQQDDEVARYFERCGALLCVVYALNGGDLHYENLIASGEHPVLIDLETLLGPRVRVEHDEKAAPDATGSATQRCAESVLAVRMLPDILVRDDGGAFNLGGLGGVDPDGTSVVVPRWRHLNSDNMRLEFVRTTSGVRASNLPVRDGMPVPASGHVDAIVDGFTRTYRAFVSRRDDLFAEHGILARMREATVRVLLRNTNLYATLIERTLQPAYLRDAVDRSVQLDALSRPLLANPLRPRIWDIVDAEHEALDSLDIPLFSARADSTVLALPNGAAIPDALEVSALDQAMRRLRSLSETDLAFQVSLIRSAFATNAAHELRVCCPEPPPTTHAVAWSRDKVVQAARRIGCRLRNAAIASGTSDERMVQWVGPEYLGRARRYRMGPLAPGLIDGASGVAFFLASLAHVTGESEWSDLALRALRPFRAALHDYLRSLRLRRLVDVGAGTGLASIVFAHVHSARLLGRPDVMDIALEVAALASPDALARNDSSDLMTGTGGAILGFLALHDATGEREWLGRAIDAGSVLAERTQTTAGSEGRWWPNRHGQPERGMAHGQSGIAMALARLARVSEDATFSDLATAAIVAERTLPYADERQGAWSHGVCGLVCSRLDLVDASGVDVEIDEFTREPDATSGSASDTIGDGTGTRIDVLLATGMRLNRPQLVDRARALGMAVAARIARDVVVTGWPASVASPGLLHGEAGIGHALLRLASPHRVPSPLMWA